MSESSQFEIRIEKGGEDQIAGNLVKLLLDFAKGKTIAGYFLIRESDGGKSHSVSSIEWASWKKEEDLHKCLRENLLEENAPFAIFSVTATALDGKIELNTSVRRLESFQAENKEDLNRLMNKTLDAYCEDFRQRLEIAIKANHEATAAAMEAALWARIGRRS
jgi:hypothetical protein